MKKILAILAILTFAGIASAQMDKAVLSATLVKGTGSTSTGTLTQVIRGNVEAVAVDIVANTTNIVTITDDYGTIFSKTCTADALYPLRYASYGSTAAALTWDAGVTNGITYNPIYVQRPMAGPVVIKAAGDNGALTTNAISVTLIYRK